MLKVLRRWGRVFGRIFAHLAGFHRSISRSVKLLTAALALLGLGLFEEWKEVLGPWLLAEWHWLTALLGMLFLGAAIALYRVEREEEARTTVQVLPEQVRPELHTGIQINNRIESDVLIIETRLRFRNSGDKPRHVRFPQLELQRRDETRRWRQRWESLPLSLHRPYSSPFARMHQRGLPNINTLWYRDKPFEIPALDELMGAFTIMGTTPGGAQDLIDRPLRLKLGVEIIGQERPSILYLPVTVTGYKV